MATRRRLTSSLSSSSLLDTSGSTRDLNSRKQLPRLSEGKPMNITNILIWKKFTRNLRQRVNDRQDDRRSFCWRGSSISRSHKDLRIVQEEEPNYRMQPDSKPNYEECKSIINKYLQEKLSDVTYDKEKTAKLSREISDDVRSRLKSDSKWPKRYKCITFVTLGQKMGQGVEVASRCAWDPSNDNYITCSYQNESIFCVIITFGVYYE